MKNVTFALILLSFVTLASGNARAITLSFDPLGQAVSTGNLASVDLNISDLTAGGVDTLGAFALDIIFDPGILTFDSVVFGPFLGNPDPYVFETDVFAVISGPGAVHLDEVSFLSNYELDAMQGDSFTLATLTFLGSNLGYSPVGLGNVVLSDAYGSQLSGPTTLQSGVIGVTRSVPEPASFILLGSSLIGLVGLRKKKVSLQENLSV